jgi:hypothetical protein
MGLKKAYLEYIIECINNTLEELSGKRMLELGNQEVLENFIPEKTGKEYFKGQGAEHISVDLNGLGGALPLDLAKPEQFIKWHSYFDVVMNSGTSEHVEPKKAQYECFSIIHDCLKVGGIAVHLVPDINELIKEGYWDTHSFNYYSHDFFRMLAEKNNYKLVSLKIIDGLICSCLQKMEDVPFMKNRKYFLRYIMRRTKGTIYHGINDRRTLHLPSWAKNIIAYSSPIRRRLGLYRWWKQKNKSDKR